MGDEGSAYPGKVNALSWLRYRHNMSVRAYLQPEKKLMLAVLEDALTRFEKHLPSQNHLFREELNWLMDTNTEPVFSFQSICESLQLDPDYVRKYLLRRSALLAANIFSSSQEWKTCSSVGERSDLRRKFSQQQRNKSFINPETPGFRKRPFLIVRASHNSESTPASVLSTKRRNV